MCDLWTHRLVWHGTFTSRRRSPRQTVFVSFLSFILSSLSLSLSIYLSLSLSLSLSHYLCLSLSLSLSRERKRETERERDVCVSLARVPPPLPPMAGSHEQAHEHARVLGSVPLSTFNSCVVPINPCPMSMFTSSSSSFSPLSRGLEHQTQLPTPVTPIPCTASLYSLRTRARTHTQAHTRPRRPRVH